MAEEWRYIPAILPYIDLVTVAVALPNEINQEAAPFSPNMHLTIKLTRGALIVPSYVDPVKDANAEACRRHNLDFVRTPSGGATVYTDVKSCYSIIFGDIRNPKHPPRLGEKYKKHLSCIADALSREFGIKARFRPVNDIEIQSKDGIWRKVTAVGSGGSGNAFYTAGYIQVSEVPMDMVEQVIPVPPEKFLDKETKSMRERMTSLEREVGREISLDEVIDVFNRSISTAYDVALVEMGLTDKELSDMKVIRELFEKEEYIYDRTEKRKFGEIPPDVKRAETLLKIPQGPLVRITVLIKGDTIYDILLTGSFHALPLPTPIAIHTSPLHEIESRLKGIKIDDKLIREKITEVYALPGYEIANTTPDHLVKGIMEACAK
jgi:lipoate-protein ligase A